MLIIKALFQKKKQLSFGKILSKKKCPFLPQKRPIKKKGKFFNNSTSEGWMLKKLKQKGRKEKLL